MLGLPPLRQKAGRGHSDWPNGISMTVPSALETVEIITTEVSMRLQLQPEIGYHLAAYYRAAFARD